MKLLPSYNLFDDTFDDMFYEPLFTKRNADIMKTDIVEKDGQYLLDMELPGYDKADIKVELNDGYLVVNAHKNNQKEEKDKKGNVVRQERYSGQCSRSFYVGDQVKEEDVKAKFENGELKIVLPVQNEKQIQEKKLIAIE